MNDDYGTTYAPPPGTASTRPAAGIGADAPPREPRAAREPVVGILAGLAEDLTLLVRQEAELMRAEVGEKVDQARSGVQALGAGALIAHAGAILLLLAIALGIDVWIDEPWISTLIVGGAAVLIGVLLLARGRSELRAGALTPRRSADSLHQDAELFREQTRRA